MVDLELKQVVQVADAVRQRRQAVVKDPEVQQIV